MGRGYTHRLPQALRLRMEPLQPEAQDRTPLRPVVTPPSFCYPTLGMAFHLRAPLRVARPWRPDPRDRSFGRRSLPSSQTLALPWLRPLPCVNCHHRHRPRPPTTTPMGPTPSRVDLPLRVPITPPQPTPGRRQRLRLTHEDPPLSRRSRPSEPTRARAPRWPSYYNTKTRSGRR